MKYKILTSLFVLVILIVLYAITNSGDNTETQDDGTQTQVQY